MHRETPPPRVSHAKVHAVSANQKGQQGRSRVVAERTAYVILTKADKEGSKITDTDVLKVLELWGFKKNESRTHVIPENKTFVNSDTFGMTRGYEDKYSATQSTIDYPNTMVLLNRWLQDNQTNPNFKAERFPYTSISINYDYAARRHRDNKNEGPSMIKAFGKFEGGGALHYWPDDDKTCNVEELPDDQKVVLDIAANLTLFDGNRGHEVSTFTGERYSVIFFSVGKNWEAPANVTDQLTKCGFPLPTQESAKYAMDQLAPPKGYSDFVPSARQAAKANWRRAKRPYWYCHNCHTWGWAHLGATVCSCDTAEAPKGAAKPDEEAKPSAKAKTAEEAKSAEKTEPSAQAPTPTEEAAVPAEEMKESEQAPAVSLDTPQQADEAKISHEFVEVTTTEPAEAPQPAEERAAPAEVANKSEKIPASEVEAEVPVEAQQAGDEAAVPAEKAHESEETQASEVPHAELAEAPQPAEETVLPAEEANESEEVPAQEITPAEPSEMREPAEGGAVHAEEAKESAPAEEVTPANPADGPLALMKLMCRLRRKNPRTLQLRR